MPLIRKVKDLIIGKPRDPSDRKIFHNLSLIAFFAWVGLGADGLSSSCYGPEETFLALQGHTYLGLFVAALSALTVLIISASYSQIIEQFPSGGGGYVVASKLLNPTLGMISGSALLIDYVLTISISIASGAAALFSFLPVEWQPYRLYFAIFGVLVLIVMNMRGAKESVVPLTPIFLIFIGTHFFAIVYALITHANGIPNLVSSTVSDINVSRTEMGLGGLMFIILRAYSLGAGTYTGIEAVSNGLPILREPRVLTAKRTMRYMSFSLAFTVAGLMTAYLLFNVHPEHGKTLNAVLFENLTANWSGLGGKSFVLVALFSEAMLLFVAAQAGFLDGPRVLANMAVDRWLPSRFASLSDRLVSQNGVMLMGLAALVTMVVTHGSVHLLVVLYSINVFITFCLSQGGMVRHWWQVRRQERKWVKRILVNGLGFVMTTVILIAVVVLKFHEGGWVTLLITGLVVTLCIFIKRHYQGTLKMLTRLDSLVETASISMPANSTQVPRFDPHANTAAILVNGFNGLGLHTVFGVVRLFGREFKNFVFIQIGVIDAGNFKGAEEIDRLRGKVKEDLDHYVDFMKKSGYFAEGFAALGTDPTEAIEEVSADVLQRYPSVVFFGGQLVFPQDSFMTRWLHNYTVFSIQRRFYQKGVPILILPIRV